MRSQYTLDKDYEYYVFVLARIVECSPGRARWWRGLSNVTGKHASPCSSDSCTWLAHGQMNSLADTVGSGGAEALQ